MGCQGHGGRLKAELANPTSELAKVTSELEKRKANIAALTAELRHRVQEPAAFTISNAVTVWVGEGEVQGVVGG